MKQIRGFKDEYRWLSNFWFVPIHFDEPGITFPTVEHAYQAAKNPEDHWVRYILSKDTPGQAKKAGRVVLLRSDWEEVKVPIMEQLITMKFSNPEMRQLLLDTGDIDIIEENYWGDRFWGVCNGRGHNMLGNIIMKERDRIKGENS